MFHESPTDSVPTLITHMIAKLKDRTKLRGIMTRTKAQKNRFLNYSGDRVFIGRCDDGSRDSDVSRLRLLMPNSYYFIIALLGW